MLLLLDGIDQNRAVQQPEHLARQLGQDLLLCLGRLKMLARLQEDFRPVGFLCRLLRLHFDFARQGANDDGDDEQEQKVTGYSVSNT